MIKDPELGVRLHQHGCERRGSRCRSKRGIPPCYLACLAWDMRGITMDLFRVGNRPKGRQFRAGFGQSIGLLSVPLVEPPADRPAGLEGNPTVLPCVLRLGHGWEYLGPLLGE